LLGALGRELGERDEPWEVFQWKGRWNPREEEEGVFIPTPTLERRNKGYLYPLPLS
jgi:hypothetical protein